MTSRGKTARAAKPPATEPVAAPAYRSEGQRLLCALTTQGNVIARELGVVPGAVSNWRAGTYIPNDKQRTRLGELFGIASAAWERVPLGALPPVAEDEPEPAPVAPAVLPNQVAGEIGPESTVLDDCLVQMTWLKKQLAREDILARERLALNDAFRKALRDKARYQLDAEMSENRMVRNHPAWRKFKVRLLEVLRRHPAAARDVTELITELLGDEERAK